MVRSRLADRIAKSCYAWYELPEKPLAQVPECPDADHHDTAVTPEQLQHLLAAVRETEHLKGSCVIEVGSWTGVTTRALAKATTRIVYAVDPFIPTGTTPVVFERFLARTRDLPNVIHLRETSGEAARCWKGMPAGLIFIDAVHDYFNTTFDIRAWETILAPGGILALHDTDQFCFAGSRRAAFEAANRYELFAHPHNLVMLRKSAELNHRERKCDDVNTEVQHD